MEKEKRILCLYEVKRYLIADLPDGRPNPNTYAYHHCDLAAKEHLVVDLPEHDAELIIKHRKERFTRKHARVTKRLELAVVMDMAKMLPNGDALG